MELDPAKSRPKIFVFGKGNRMNTKRLLLGLYFIFLMALGIQGCHKETVASDWPPEAKALLEPLTTGTNGWKAGDLGNPVSQGDSALLQRFLPRVTIGPNSTAPVDFYQYYLPKSVIRNRDGQEVVRAPSREVLQSHERTVGEYLDFEGDHYPCRGEGCRALEAPIYGSVFNEKVDAVDGLAERRVKVLRFSSVFPASGLPWGLSWWQRWFANLAGEIEVWHELDIHGAYFLIVDEATSEPLIVLLAQHNHFRSFVVGVDLEWPRDDRLEICYANRSNEPYLCPEGDQPASFPATGQPSSLRYIFTGKKSPIDGSYDTVYGKKSGGTPLESRLVVLSDQDPLYCSWINLGDKRKIFWFFDSFFRFGPPGMNLNRFPKLKSHLDIARFYYFDPNDDEAFVEVEEKITNYFAAEIEPLLVRNGQKLNLVLVKKLSRNG